MLLTMVPICLPCTGLKSIEHTVIQSFPTISVYYFAIAAMPSCPKFSSLQLGKFILLQFWRSNFKWFSLGLNQGVILTVFLSGGWRRESIFLPFQPLEDAHIPWLVASFLLLQNLQLQHSYCASFVISFPLSCDYIETTHIVQDNVPTLKTSPWLH